MVYKEIKFEKSASILIMGDGESIRIELRRGGSVEWSHKISKNPGWLEGILPSYIDEIKMAPLFANKEQREKIYRSRIKVCLAHATVSAQRYVIIDKKQEENIKRTLAREKENGAKMDDFIDNIVADINKIKEDL